MAGCWFEAWVVATRPHLEKAVGCAPSAMGIGHSKLFLERHQAELEAALCNSAEDTACFKTYRVLVRFEE